MYFETFVSGEGTIENEIIFISDIRDVLYRIYVTQSIQKSRVSKTEEFIQSLPLITFYILTEMTT